MLVKACLNGARGAHEHPALSADPVAMAREAAAAAEAGAGALHVHPKDDDGADSLAAAHVSAWVRAMREACPNTPVGVTTGAWSAPDPAQRLAELRAWSDLPEERPDFASVNWHEPGAEETAELLLSRGIGVEAGVWHAEGLRAWLASPLRGRCLRVLVEVQDIPAHEVEDTARGLVSAVREAEPGLPLLLHGEERSAWTAAALAVSLGLDTRAGLEDSLVLPDGTPASGNAQLIRAVLD
ncbi:3-keto-5-aminohexanoate cleavage protein [Arthrobacter sp. UM1]|uniref:3-keto-5-aminohexanoate cleavage protein n=1 Tax=Arthrobacter sp. UM1 TaxID=2766776 RepID=UPI001CF6F687|nr:3-keto-5-aminohexanoate cleavage protein [Arthrobacter sp. UM1]MCB4208660.1 3-keto-5-aminohexanoate cleavage protein [Arthrobacter sp. UM1]